MGPVGGGGGQKVKACLEGGGRQKSFSPTVSHFVAPSSPKLMTGPLAFSG